MVAITVHNNKVYITEYGNKRISVFQTNGKFYISLGSDQFSEPTDVAVSADNHLLIADSNKSCIHMVTLDGHYVRKIGTPGSGKGQLCGPYSLTTDLNGFIIVADSSNHCVTIFDKDGNSIHCFSSRGSTDGQFNFLME